MSTPNKDLLCAKLMSTSEAIEKSPLPDGQVSETWGYNQPYCHKEDISNIFSNLAAKLESVYVDQDIEIDENLLESHLASLNEISSKITSYSDVGNLPSILGAFTLSSFALVSDIEHDFLSWEVLNEKELLPKSLTKRCLGIKNSLKAVENDAGDLSLKVKEINRAREAAESLPTDIELLREARAEMKREQDKFKQHIDSIIADINESKQESFEILTAIRVYSEEVRTKQAFIETSSDRAKVILDECDNAMQVSTTQGIASGFDLKAKELKNSIWVYIAGLILALGAGAYLGAQRVEAFNEIIKLNLSMGQAFAHTIMSIFAIGGPLWAAWICTQQINHRFKLAEDYSYKATVSKSFMGFKKLSEEFDKDTQSRLFNSTLDRLDEMPLRLIQGKDYNSPWHEFIDSEAFKKAVDIVPQLAREAGRFANNTKMKKATINTKPQNVTPIHRAQENNDLELENGESNKTPSAQPS